MMNTEKTKTQKEIEYEFCEYLRSRDFNESTISQYLYTIRYFAEQCETSLRNASSIDLREIMCRLYDKITPTTQNQYRTHLIAFYRYMLITGYTDSNPARDIPIRKTAQKLVNVPSSDTIRKIVCEEYDKSDHVEYQKQVIIKTIICTGMKCKDIAEIKQDDISFLPKGLYIRRKNNKVSFYPTELIKGTELQLYMQTLKKDDIFLFPDFVTSRKISAMIKRELVAKCEEHNCTSGSLRNAFAMAMLEAGVRNIFVARVTGITTTNLSKYYEQHIDELIEKMQGTFQRK